MKNLITLHSGAAAVAVKDPWELVDTQEGEAAPGASGSAYRILPLSDWRQLSEVAAKRSEATAEPMGVLLHPDDDPADLAPWIDRIALIALEFPSFRDGRAYTQAFVLRSRLGFRGELRAIGDVLRDQLVAMRHCGFSSFAVRGDRSAEDALKGLAGFDLIYARSVACPEPLFRRRLRAGEPGESDQPGT
ncbi:DUF934 domain-containing protein [Marinobacterium sedimentorum]|uniref:DUF934 domain-containing protein n=1 Tax=Marinobacterium sedimentorum TaxID=2927804 RepID=UPI0020C5D300|nr:DUF934 domain-containing protein [Marinobacterium sedimentorum]MCP8687272.1 DUF934 domain-containing protein [Marinobacterium sedimentorum]